MPRTKNTTVPLDAKALAKVINKKYGPGTMKFGNDPSLEITRIPCGVLSVDCLLGGGFPRGRHIEIYGTFSVGKTYITMRLIAAAQERGENCAYVDAEGTFDPTFAALCGVNVEELSYHRQVNGQRCVDFMETLLRSELYAVIVLDSIASLLPKSEAESEAEAATMGTAQAKLMSAALRKLTAANKQTVLVYINQTREAVGVMFGKRSITSGGKAMGFYAGVRLEFVRTENIKRKGRVVNPTTGVAKVAEVVKGHRVLMRKEKDKTGGGRQQATSSMVFDYELQGVDPIEDLLYLGREYEFIHKSGSSWWVEGYEDEQVVGRGKFKSWLRRNRAVSEELTDWIMEAVEHGQQEDPEEDIEEDEDDEG